MAFARFRSAADLLPAAPEGAHYPKTPEVFGADEPSKGERPGLITDHPDAGQQISALYHALSPGASIYFSNKEEFHSTKDHIKRLEIFARAHLNQQAYDTLFRSTDAAALQFLCEFADAYPQAFSYDEEEETTTRGNVLEEGSLPPPSRRTFEVCRRLLKRAIEGAREKAKAKEEGAAIIGELQRFDDAGIAHPYQPWNASQYAARRHKEDLQASVDATNDFMRQKHLNNPEAFELYIQKVKEQTSSVWNDRRSLEQRSAHANPPPQETGGMISERSHPPTDADLLRSELGIESDAMDST